MNKIKVASHKKLDKKIDHTIIVNDYSKLNTKDEDILFIYIPKNINTDLELSFDSDDTYQKITFLIDDYSSLNLLDYKINDIDSNYQYNFILKDHSKLLINKFYGIDNIKEIVNINLEGFNSSLTYHFATITNKDQTYILNIKHLNQKTRSNVINHGLTLKQAKLELEVNGFIPKGMKESILNQDNKIMIMDDNNSIIKPHLYIDEYQVEAKHGASIGKFHDDIIFYLQSRGLSLDECYNLLMKGFLLEILKIEDKQKNKFITAIENYGR